MREAAEQRGRRPRGATLLWAAIAALLLAAGFVAVVYRASLGAAPDSVRETQAALALYARVVLVKGLLPQLALTVVAWSWLDRRVGLSRRGPLGVAASLLAVSAAAALLVAPTLLPLALPGLPAVHFRDAANTARSVIEMALATAAACWLARLGVGRLRPG